MPYIPLIEHAHPRVLMLDFAQHDVIKIKNAGFEARRGSTGLHDRKEFSLPFATQDVEVIFAQVQAGSFTSEERTAATESVEEQPFFKDLMRETWQKAGWTVLFISQNTSPKELNAIGLESVGVITQEHHHIPESVREPLLKVLENYRRHEQRQSPEIPLPQMPRFRGQAIYTSNESEAPILQRYIKTARMSIFTCLSHPLNWDHIRDAPQPHVVTFSQKLPVEWLIQDGSADKNIMALKINNSVYAGQDDKQPIYNLGGILLLPDFGENNGNVSLALLQEVFTLKSPHLFDTPQHPWLEKYQPAPVIRLQKQRNLVVEEAMKKIKHLDEQAEAESLKYAWLLGLLVSTGDQFAEDIAQALRFLDFEVEEVDNALLTGERKREDYRIWDRSVGYFAIGEAKTTGKGRGAAEEFITKTQTHQARYAHEHRQIPPPALLIINYAIDLDPKQRVSRFYQREVTGRLEDNVITALSSVALFDICQFVLNEQLSKEHARQFIIRGQPMIASVTLEELIG